MMVSCSCPACRLLGWPGLPCLPWAGLTYPACSGLPGVLYMEDEVTGSCSAHLLSPSPLLSFLLTSASPYASLPPFSHFSPLLPPVPQPLLLSVASFPFIIT